VAEVTVAGSVYVPAGGNMEVAMWELPIVRGLLVCERAETDPQTRRLTFVNRRTRYLAPAFPTGPTNWAVFAALADGFGSVPITLVIERPGSEVEVVRYGTTVEFADRLREVPLLLNVRNVVFPAAGTYVFTLLAGDEPLASQPLAVTGRTTGE
jgi:hypothetical protein